MSCRIVQEVPLSPHANKSLQASRRPEMATVSVIVPVLNQEPYIDTALNSVLSQEGVALDVIVVDNGSTDRTRERIAGFGDKVRLFQTDRPGAAAARNLGLRHAKGAFIAFLDGDDYWLPGKLQAQTAALAEHPEAALCHMDWALWYPDPATGIHPAPETLHDAPPPSAAKIMSAAATPEWVYPALLFWDLMCTDVVMFRRDLLNEIRGFDEDLLVAEDIDFWAQICSRHKAIRLQQLGALYRQHRRNQTRTYQGDVHRVDVIQRWLSRTGMRFPDGREFRHPDVANMMAVYWWRRGMRALRAGDRSAVATALREAAAYKAPSRRARIMSAMSCHPVTFAGLRAARSALDWRDHVMSS
jgi:glycosyltransferase involved in cell wall biosynthesis